MLVAELVSLRKNRTATPITQPELTALEASIASWFSTVAVPRQHLIPCSIMPDPASGFSIGSVRFLHIGTFDPADFGGTPATNDINFGVLAHSMQERAATWLAIVPVSGCEANRSAELADLAVDIALAALQLIIPPDYGARTARITGRTMPPYTVSVAVTGQGPQPTITNLESGKGMSGAAFDTLLQINSPILHSAGSRVANFLSGGGRLPKLDRAWCDAAFWFHEALAEPLETVAIAKLETSIENLFGAGNLTESTAQLLQGIKGVFGLSKSDLIAPGSTVKVGEFAANIVTARSRILHGTWSTLGEELPLGRGDVASLARTMLVSYTLFLDQYEQTPSPEDKAKPFVDWMEARGPLPMGATPPAPPTGP